MFGYVNANKAELTPEGTALYQSYYCGLCQELKRVAGKRGQLFLNYDVTFLCLLLSGLYEPEETTDSFTCRLHPRKKKDAVQSPIMTYGAKMDLLLSYYNLLDDFEDDGSRTKKKIADSLRPDIEKIREEYPRQGKAAEVYISKLEQAEKTRESNLTKVANLTGEMLGEFLCCHDDDVWNDALKELGLYLGRFIYVMDAYEDQEEDRKKGRYNPLLVSMENCPRCYETFVRQFLTTQMSECARVFEKLPILKNAEVIRNILYSGVWTKYDYLQIKKERVDRKTS